jgi:hypothetical protein
MSLFDNIRKALQTEAPPDKPAPRLCAAGLHARDSHWKDGPCMYCEAEKNKLNKSRLAADDALAPPPRAAQRGAQRGATRVDDGLLDAQDGGAAARGDQRRVLGVLVSYTWEKAGQLFVLRNGRNTIGTDAAQSPPDIEIGTDPTLSREHAVILFQGDDCYVHDLTSVNGTWVQGRRLIPGATVEIPSPATIKTGSTVWTFLRIPADTAAPQPAEPPVADARDEPFYADDDETPPQKPPKPRGETLVG